MISDLLYWHRSRPSNTTFLPLFARKQTDSNDTHPMHFLKVTDRLARRRNFDHYTYHYQRYMR